MLSHPDTRRSIRSRYNGPWQTAVDGLIEAARSSGRRIVGITAPAGYGKSTLLAEWAQVEDRRPSATYLLPYHAVRLRLQLATVYLALAEQATVRQLLREIDDVVSRRPGARRRVDRERAGRLIIQYPYQGDAEAAFAYSRLRQ